MSTPTPTTAEPTSPNGHGAPPRQTVPAVRRPKTRLRPSLVALGIAITALGALTGAYLVGQAGQTQQFVAVARPLAQGEVIERADLTTADITSDPALRPVPAERIDALVGQRAATSLRAGALLTEDSVTREVLPGPGKSIVGVALRPSRLPSEPLTAGDTVRIVDTPAEQGDPPADTPASITAAVVSTSQVEDEGLVVVDVLVDEADAASLAARAATGRVAIVLDSRHG